MLMGQKVQLGVSKPTLVIFGTFEVGKAYRVDLIL